MANPILPGWEHIPDGEPRLFGDRVYLYGSHDRPRSDSFCDTKLKVWSAPKDDLSNWTCHGDCFHIKADGDHESDISWEARSLFAPDVVEKDGKYYLFAYIYKAQGAIAVSDRPEGPFKLLNTYQYEESEDLPPDFCNNRVFVDPGVLVDDDGKVYVYCGLRWSYVVQMDENDITKVKTETYKPHIIPVEPPFKYFEACSPRKINGTYYLVYSQTRGCCLDYATSDSPMGPFVHRGTIIDNGIDYPGGNDHGGLVQIDGQWYIFYHRTTNNTCFSRQGCVERVTILPDGTIPQVEMTSLGFEESLNPYRVTPAYNACVLTGKCVIKEFNVMDIRVCDIMDKSVIGYKYYDFGEDFSNTSMKIHLKLAGRGEKGRIHVRLDDLENGEELCSVDFDGGDTIVTGKTRCVTGRHALYLVFEDDRIQDPLAIHDRMLCDLKEFVFTK